MSLDLERQLLDLKWRHKKLLHDVDLVIKALQGGGYGSTENCLIILNVAKVSDTRMGEADARS